jgi:hypothetical protein
MWQGQLSNSMVKWFRSGVHLSVRGRLRFGIPDRLLPEYKLLDLLLPCSYHQCFLLISEVTANRIVWIRMQVWG